ncbi:lipopolysaccharide assembly protein LapB [Azoarcus sp. KH32C]|uniref:tetratricopeptide repeat protein n=1 Tax=Azoarcus sp. KH32C TaxID=748247 RepID=UPI0002386AF6|nr:hypothetical protein [Azoarcus sp. KH32C]BAL22722.1 hypothetical protein AZKH_0376 [Azoarcus sp. KH32C]
MPATPPTPPARPARGRDYRKSSIIAVPFAIATIATIVSLLPGRGVESGSTVSHSPFPYSAPHGPDRMRTEETAEAPPKSDGLTIDPNKDPAGHQDEVKRVTINAMLGLARDFLKAGQPDRATESTMKAMYLDPKNPDAYHVMGDIMMQRRRFAQARDYYESEIDRDPMRADAYFSHATASEALGDLESALGGMRSFLHVVPDKDPFRLKVAQARSAIWEWESKLGRGPWGPTRGIPPGFTEAELRRDGKGVAVKMPIPGTQDKNGVQQYEIKHADRIEMYKKP